MRDEIRRLTLFGSGIAELTRNRAEQLVKDLVQGGDVRREHASTVVRELLERNRQARRELGRFVNAEIQNQLQRSGIASKRDFERLERRVARIEAALKEGGVRKTAPSAGARKTRGGTPKRTAASTGASDAAPPARRRSRPASQRTAGGETPPGPTGATPGP